MPAKVQRRIRERAAAPLVGDAAMGLCIAIPTLLFFAFGIWLVGEQLDRAVLLRGLAFVGFLSGIAVIAARLRTGMLAATAAALASLLLVSLVGMAMGYGVFFVGREFPLLDHHFIAIDRSMGFDWISMLAWFDRHPELANPLQYAYSTTGWQALFVLSVLIAAGERDRLGVFIAANALTLLLVHLIGIFTPAIGAYGALGITPGDHPNIELISNGLTVAPSLAMREAGVFALPEGRLQGLMTFPSYHSAAGALVAWSLWHFGWLRLPGVILGVLVIVSALLHGSHHLIDAIAGAGLALACVALAVALRRKLAGLLQHFAASRNSPASTQRCDVAPSPSTPLRQSCKG